MKEREYSTKTSFQGYSSFIKEELGIESLTTKQAQDILKMYINGVPVEKAISRMEDK